MSEKKLPNGMKIVFAPGAFDHFEGTQEELDALVKEINEKISDGTFFDNCQPVNIEDDEYSEEDALLIEEFLLDNGNRTLQ